MAPTLGRRPPEPAVTLGVAPRDWIYDPSRIGRSAELMRTTTTERVQAPEESFWSSSRHVGGGAGEAEQPPAEMMETTQAFDKTSLSSPAPKGEIFLSHVWDEPEDWPKFFPKSSYEHVKGLQVDAITKRLAHNRLGESAKFRELGLWVDRAAVPASVHREDHPLVKTSFGPYRMPTKELKRILFKEDTQIYASVRKEEAHQFEGVLRIRERDIFGTPKANPTDVFVKWELPPGQYVVQKVCVTEQDGVPHLDYGTYQMVRDGPLKRWLHGHQLRDDIWLQVTYGSCRCECLKMVETLIARHEVFVAVMPWNYFDRLWAMYEWCIFNVVHGLGKVRLAVDVFLKGSAGEISAQHLEYRRMLRRLSTVNAKSSDARDADLLWQKIQYFFQCDADTETTYAVPKKTETDILIGDVYLRKTRKVDFSRFERLIRATTIAAFAREMALTKANSEERERTEDFYFPWVDLAKEFELTKGGPSEGGLYYALRECKPYKWRKNCADDGERYVREVDQWFAASVLPVMEEEIGRAVRPFMLDEKQRNIRAPNDATLVNPFHAGRTRPA